MSCRASASPPGRLPSASTHIPPTGAQLPSVTAFLIRSKISGRCSFIHAYCCAEEQAKTSSGYSRASVVMLVKVRAHLRTVSRIGHSHAESMCAWPTAVTVCAEACAGRDSTPVSRSRAACAVPGTSAASTASMACWSARRISCRREEPSGSSRISSSSTSMSCVRCHTASSRTAISAARSRYRCSLPAVSLEPKRVPTARAPSIIGLAASSTSRSTGSPPAADSASSTLRWCGCRPWTGEPDASWTKPSAWPPGPLDRSKPRSKTASTRRPAQLSGMRPLTLSQQVDQGPPQVSPIATGS